MNRETTLLLLNLALIPMFVGLAKADEEPLRCSYTQGNGEITCDVLLDDAKVTYAEVNRNKCNLPIHFDMDVKAKLKAITDSASPSEQADAQGMLVEYLIGLQAYDPSMFKGRKPEEIDKMNIGTFRIAAAMYFLMMNPIGNYKFGDKITMYAFGCNVLEWKFTINGEDYTWGKQ